MGHGTVRTSSRCACIVARSPYVVMPVESQIAYESTWGWLHTNDSPWGWLHTNESPWGLSQLGAGCIPMSHLGAGCIPMSHLGAGCIPMSHLGAGCIPMSHLGAGCIPKTLDRLLQRLQLEKEPAAEIKSTLSDLLIQRSM